MRITNNMLINNMMNNIGNNLTRMERYQNQLATGKKIQIPSDDPVVAARALKLRTDVSEIDQYQRNIKDAESWLDITEGALGNIGDIIQRTRELAVQASNGTNTPDDTQKIQKEIKQLKTQMVHLANTTYAGRYIFSGYSTDKKLINDDEDDPNFGKFAINVDTNIERIKYEIGIGDDININVAGGDLFNNGRNAVYSGNGIEGTGNVGSLTIDGTNDILDINVDGLGVVSASIPHANYTTINALASAVQDAVNSAVKAVYPNSADISVTPNGSNLQFVSGNMNGGSIAINPSSAVNALGLSTTAAITGDVGQTGTLVQDFDKFISFLQIGDHAGISNLIGKLDADMSNLLRIRADIGARQNRLELTGNRLDSDNINFTKLMSENEDVDMAETIMNLQNEENVYRASLSGGAKIIQPSLVDFLR